MVKKLKRAFTITELVIVIAVIAILAAVLIPTFTSLINKANQSSDQSAVRNMNLALQNAEVDGELETLSEALAILEEAGMNAKNYSTLVKNTAFVWVRSVNRVLYVNTEDYSVIYPEEYKTMSFDWSEAWPTLEGAIRGNDDWQNTVISDSELENTAEGAQTYGVVKDASGNITDIKVDTPARLVSAAEYLDKEENDGKVIDLYLGGNIDLEGAEWNSIDHLYGNFNGNGYTISNLRMTDTTAYSDQIKGGSGNNYTFYGFVSLFKGTEFKNVKIDVQIDKPGIPGVADDNTSTTYRNHTVAGAIGGIFQTGVEGAVNVLVEDVKVTGSITGYSRVGGIIGFIGGLANVTGQNNNLMLGSVTISECTNEAKLVSDYYMQPTLTGYSTVGGIVSIVNQTNSTFVFNVSGCTNIGDLTGARVGGIAAILITNAQWNFTECTNSGDIIVKSLTEASKDSEPYFGGGIVGAGQNVNSTGHLTVNKCVSSGNIIYEGSDSYLAENASLYGGRIVGYIDRFINGQSLYYTFGTGENANVASGTIGWTEGGYKHISTED